MRCWWVTLEYRCPLLHANKQTRFYEAANEGAVRDMIAGALPCHFCQPQITLVDFDPYAKDERVTLVITELPRPEWERMARAAGA